ncbi:Elongator subunit elp4 [Vermiconidia calcicola]|uniref:Elongator subunit elp4 n=1 Tax=Vermiconidia calcicola TaxID=1690605 RepID=A0ACC3NDF4_9PEZI|nr:Elongator subunit elp4 [Vermiconidia calcicola]
MAFRKRNVTVGRSTTDGLPSQIPVQTASGIRPSTLTSQPVTSTGTSSLDALLGGHGGLALGCSLLVEESGTTDFAGAILRYYAAEGMCHGHVIHVVGLSDSWIRELPGVAEGKASSRREGKVVDEQKMKIAWRYEQLGQAGERAVRDHIPSSQPATAQPETQFCHIFDLTKRLTIPHDASINHIPISPGPAPFDTIVRTLEQRLASSSANSVHRLVIPTILSPALYPSQSSRPEIFIRFLHSLRALLRKYSTKLTAMITLPLELYPRGSALVRWAEIFSDGVLELTPFPHLMDASNSSVESGGAKSNEEQPQGMVKVHKLPINTERGEGGAGAGNSMGEDLAFSVSRRKFVIKPFSLPPLEGDEDAQKEAGKLTGKDVEF